MRNLKKILALALALVMTLSVMTVANAAFTDSSSIDAKYTEAVDVLSGMGVFKGTGDGTTFSPKAEITRAEVAAIIYRIVTGDVTDAQAGIYADYAKFADVNTNAWYAGYVGYCANANLIKGDGKNFYPLTKVTGYQALAMILRAMGYDQNGEFTGSGWEVKVASTAQQRGILVNVNAGTLGVNATRELVAEVLFQAIQKSTVVYTPALGYYTADIIPGNNLTTTLGGKTFGLTYATGIVVGNQATGEASTLISFETTNNVTTACYDYAHGNSFNITTGLDMFGHAVKVWYDGRMTANKTVYASYDKATKVATVTAADASLASTATNGLKSAVVAAGFSNLSSTAHYSNAYRQMTAATVNGASINPNACGLYVVVSNNALLTTDVVVRLDAEVALISQINTTAINAQTLTLSNSTYGTAGTIGLASVTAGSVTTLGSVVIAKQVAGTNAANTALPYYDLSATSTKTGTVAARDNTTGKVVLSDGSTIEISPLAKYTDVVKSGVVMPGTWQNATYSFVLDGDGKYIGAAVVNTNSFIYGTFADYADGGLNTGVVNYYLTGVTLDGQIVTKDITTAIGGNSTTYLGLDVAKKTWSGNNFATGAHTGYAINETGALVAVTSANEATVGVKVLKSAKTITKDDVATGYKAVNTNGSQFMSNATKFIVVSGTGTNTLSVKTYNGIAELLGTADSVKIAANNVYYTRSAYIYNNVAGQTYHIDTVILGADDLTYTTTSNVYYCHTVAAGLTDAKTGAVQYTLYQNGVAGNYYISGTAPTADTFYTLTETTNKTVNGETVYTVTSTTTGTVSGTYVYQGATNNLDTAYIEGLKTVTGATVVNLVNPALALGSIAELNNAVSSHYTITVDCVLNAAGAVTVIYVTGATLA